MHPHLPGNEAMNDMAVFQLNLEGCVREVFNNLTLHLDVIFLSHTATYLIIGDPLKLAFFKRLSY